MTTPETASRFPLSWPDGWPRTPSHQRRRAAFGTKQRNDYKRQLTVATAMGRLIGQLARLGAKSELLSTNLDIRLDGLPRSGQAEPEDRGAAVWFWLKKKPLCLACDKWDRVADNIGAIAHHIDALRRIDRYGVGSIEQAFAGYVALPPKATEWWVILGVRPDASLDEVNARFRELARANHPDAGGNVAEFQRLTEARRAAAEVLGRS
jgi:hypothetical protein